MVVKHPYTEIQNYIDELVSKYEKSQEENEELRSNFSKLRDDYKQLSEINDRTFQMIISLLAMNNELINDSFDTFLNDAKNEIEEELDEIDKNTDDKDISDTSLFAVGEIVELIDPTYCIGTSKNGVKIEITNVKTVKDHEGNDIHLYDGITCDTKESYVSFGEKAVQKITDNDNELNKLFRLIHHDINIPKGQYKIIDLTNDSLLKDILVLQEEILGKTRKDIISEECKKSDDKIIKELIHPKNHSEEKDKDVEETNVISNSERGTGGFGSTMKGFIKQYYDIHLGELLKDHKWEVSFYEDTDNVKEITIYF